MSVILFEPSEVYLDLAISYEKLKDFCRFHDKTFTEDEDNQFYKSLRRMYFANVACYLCQYHCNNSINTEGISTFKIDLKKLAKEDKEVQNPEDYISDFLDAFGALEYNLCTNDGENYIAEQAFSLLKGLKDFYTRNYFR